jgi:GTPase SAR1 family protein
MELIKSDIKFNYDFTNIEGISNDIFPPNFLCTIIGKPGSGKTTLLRTLLLNPNLLNKKYDYVFIASPSIEEFPFIVNKQQITNKFDLDWFHNILQICINTKTHIDALLIIDDYISQLRKNQANPLLMSLFFNRRHLIKNGTLSIIITSQRYMTIPPCIRSTTTMIILFSLTRKDIERIWEEHINLSKKQFISLTTFEYKDYFLICNLQDYKYYLKFDQVVFSQ